MLAIALGLAGPGALVAASGYALLNCGKKRETVHRANQKSQKSSQRSVHSKKPTNSAKPSRSASSRGRKLTSSKKGATSRKSLKSEGKSKSGRGKNSAKMSGSTRTAKSGKSGKNKSRKSKSKSIKNKSKSKAGSGAISGLRHSSHESSARGLGEARPGRDKGQQAVKPVNVKLSPAELAYKPYGGMKEVTIVNDSNEKRAFKVKCSDNLIYRVSPVYGIVEPGKSVKIDVLRQNGGAKTDKLIVVTAKAEGEEANAKLVFERQDSKKPQEMMVLPLLVASE